jgi:hypothetical protein
MQAMGVVSWNFFTNPPTIAPRSLHNDDDSANHRTILAIDLGKYKCQAGAAAVGKAVASSSKRVGLRADTDHTTNADGNAAVTVDCPKPPDTQRHLDGRGENGTLRNTGKTVRAHYESSAAEHPITAIR